jgi:hypothetical protein
MRRNRKIRDTGVGDSNTSLMDILGNSLGGVLFILLLVMVIMVLLPKQLATLKPLLILPEREEVIDLPPATVGERYVFMLPTTGGNENVGFTSLEPGKELKLPDGLSLETNDLLSVFVGKVRLHYLRSKGGELKEAEKVLERSWEYLEADFSTNSTPGPLMEKSAEQDVSKLRWGVKQRAGFHRFQLLVHEPSKQPPGAASGTQEVTHVFDAEGATVPTFIGFSGVPKGPETTNEFVVTAFSTPTEQGWLQVDRIIKYSQPKKYRLRVLSPSAKRIDEVQSIAILSPTNLPDVRLNSRGEASVDVVAEGGVPPYRWEAQAKGGNAISIGRDGKVTVRLKEPSEVHFQATVHSANEELLRKFNKPVSASQEFVWRVLPTENDLEMLVPAVLPPAVAGESYTFPLAARGGTGAYRWLLAASAKSNALPAWLSIEDDAVKASSTATVERRSYYFSLQLTDGRPGRQPISKEVELPVIKKMIIIDEGNPRYKLEITTADPLPEATRGVFYPLVIAARGGIPPYHWAVTNCLYRAIGSTDWTSLSIANGTNITELGLGFNFEQQFPQYNGLFGGKPEKSGEFKITFLVFDSDLAGRKGPSSDFAVGERTLKVLPSPEDIAAKPLKILSPPKLPDGIEGVAYQLAFSGTGGAPPYDWSLDGKTPKGFGFKNPTDGVLTGAPDRESVGNHEFFVVLSDRRGTNQAEKLKVSLKVRPGSKPLKIVTTGLPDALLGKDYAAPIQTEGGEPPLRWQVVTGSLPDGLILQADSGNVTGKATTITQVPSRFRIAVSEANGQTVEGDIAMSVLAGIQPGPLKILTDEVLPVGFENQGYKATLAVLGGIPPYKWAKGTPWPDTTAGLLKLSEDGVLENRVFPNAGTHILAASVVDSASNRADSQFRLIVRKTGEVEPPPGKLEIRTSELPPALTVQNYFVALSIQGGRSPYTLSLEGELPPGLTFRDGAVSGIPTTPLSKPVPLKFSATDSQIPPDRAVREMSLVVLRSSVKDLSAVEPTQWLWLAAILAGGFIAQKLWQRFCLIQAQK